jgi:diguanylate cyclase (GGDEF)-like protein
VLVAGAGPAVLAIYDLDGFKGYNDTFGHPAGDALLVRLGRALQTTLAKRGDGYRLGGDEFCVLLPGELDAALPVLDAVSGALCERGEGFSVTSTWGAVNLPEEGSTAEEALRIADQRMYARKQARCAQAARQPALGWLRSVPVGDGDRDSARQTLAVPSEGTPQPLPRHSESLSA